MVSLTRGLKSSVRKSSSLEKAFKYSKLNKLKPHSSTVTVDELASAQKINKTLFLVLSKKYYLIFLLKD